MRAGETTYDVGGFKVPAYYAAPAGRTGLPVVLVIQEIFGVHEYIADTARRFAKAGYLAIAPELFERQGDAQSYGEMAKLMAEVIAKVPDAQVMGDLDACVKWAVAHGGDAKKLAVTGFCWGGRQAWLFAAHNRSVKAGVAWYGRLVGAPSALTPAHPVDLAGKLHPGYDFVRQTSAGDGSDIYTSEQAGLDEDHPQRLHLRRAGRGADADGVRDPPGDGHARRQRLRALDPEGQRRR